MKFEEVKQALHNYNRALDEADVQRHTALTALERECADHMTEVAKANVLEALGDARFYSEREASLKGDANELRAVSKFFDVIEDTAKQADAGGAARIMVATYGDDFSHDILNTLYMNSLKDVPTS